MDEAIRDVDGSAGEHSCGFGLAPQRFRHYLVNKLRHSRAIAGSLPAGKGGNAAIPISGANARYMFRHRYTDRMEDKMRLSHIVVPSLLALLAAAPAHAQETARYQLEKTANGYVRMDTQTGAMSTCEERSGQLVCRMAADERTAAMDEIDRLNRSIEDLDGRVARLENSLAAKLESSLPSEEEFNKTMSYMERFLRGFLGIVKDMEKDNGSDPGKPVPQKT